MLTGRPCMPCLPCWPVGPWDKENTVTQENATKLTSDHQWAFGQVTPLPEDLDQTCQKSSPSLALSGFFAHVFRTFPLTFFLILLRLSRLDFDQQASQRHFSLNWACLSLIRTSLTRSKMQTGETESMATYWYTRIAFLSLEDLDLDRTTLLKDQAKCSETGERQKATTAIFSGYLQFNNNYRERITIKQLMMAPRTLFIGWPNATLKLALD